MKVIGVIVTYNRKKLLKNTFEALLNQTYKLDSIIIVDNASTDGTEEYLTNLGYLNNSMIKYIKLNENTGGAGGFNFGIKEAIKEMPDWVWVMDDDGIPECTCLSELLKYKEESLFLAPLVLDINDHSQLSFSYNGSYDKEVVLNNSQDGKIIRNLAAPFNGILLSKVLIDKVGVPLEGMFIWGDEQEYYKRILLSGTVPTTVISARHFHPKDRIKLSSTLFGKKNILYPEGKLRQYCVFRNYTYINKKYHGIIGLIKRLIIYTYFFVITRKLDFKGLIFFYSAYIDGLNENFDKHKRYI